MSILYSPSTIVGTPGWDFIISTSFYTDSNLSGGDGNDLLLGDFHGIGVILSGSIAFSSGSALNVDDSILWTTDPDDLFASTTPHTTVYVEGQAGATKWIKFFASAGDLISFDVDFAYNSGFASNSDVVVELRNSAANVLLLAVDDSTSTDPGSYSVKDPSYNNFVAPTSGYYWIHLSEYDGSFEGDEAFLVHIAVSGHAATGTMSAGNDVLSGGNGNDEIYGMGGNDTIDGGSGTDYLLGGDGNDSIAGGDGNDNIEGGNGTDNIDGGNGDDIVYGQAGDDVIAGGAGFDRLNGGDGNDSLSGGLGWDVLAGGTGNDTVHGDDGRDVLFGWTQGNIQGTYQGGSDTYYGDADVDLIFAGTLSDTIFGGAGDDIILGDRTYVGYASRSTSLSPNLSFSLNDPSIWSTEYWDIVPNSTTVPHTTWYVETYPNEFRTFSINLVAGQTITVDIDAGFAATAGSNINTIVSLYFNNSYVVTAEGGPYDSGDTGVSNTTLTYVVPTTGAYYIVVNEHDFDNQIFDGDESFLMNVSVTGHAATAVVAGAADSISGGDGWDTISGGLGDDTIDGGTGGDSMAGGPGNDTYYVDRLADIVTEFANEGTDTILTSAPTTTLPSNVENLVYVSNSYATLTGNSLNNAITGGPAPDMLSGGLGNDTLDGGAGGDTMSGGGDNDTYIVDSLTDVVTENTGEGTDTVRTGIGTYVSDLATIYYLPANVENLEMNGGAGQVVAGNSLSNLITGTANNDVIVIGDTVAPYTSANMGADTVNAGGGNDYVFANHAFDAADQIDGGSGFDVVGLLGAYNVTLGASTLTNVEKLDAYSSGNAGSPNNYTLTMNDGNVAAGQQLFVTAASLMTVEHLNFNGSAETNGKFLIYGGHGTDTIVGGAGADRIIGGEGADTLTGGAGNDAFQFNLKTDSTTAARDTITDFATGDKLDFYFFDANDNAGGSQHFTFIGTAAFSNVAGQLKVVDQGSGHWLVEADTNGDGVADFSLAVTSDHALGLGDFNL